MEEAVECSSESLFSKSDYTEEYPVTDHHTRSISTADKASNPSELHETSRDDDTVVAGVAINTENNMMEQNQNNSNICEVISPADLPEPESSACLDTSMVRQSQSNAECHLVGHCGNIFQTSSDNFLKGCKWSPDGRFILSSSGLNGVEVFDSSADFVVLQSAVELRSTVKIPVKELVYDLCWYPFMDQRIPLTCCFLTTCRGLPIQLWDSQTGELRGSYRAFDHLDELNSAYSLKFSEDGQKIYCGFKKMIRVFDITRPGRNCISRPTFCVQGQKGIISCLATSKANHSMYAAGSYMKTVALYSEPTGDIICMLQGHRGGVTHLQFSPDGTKLYSGGRMDAEILCWDIRNPGNILYTLQRQVSTNQRMYFDLDCTGRYIVSGNHNGTVSVWDSMGSTHDDPSSDEAILDPLLLFKAHNDCVSSVSFHPFNLIISTGSGQRHIGTPGSSDSDNSDNDTDDTFDNSLKVWRIDH